MKTVLTLWKFISFNSIGVIVIEDQTHSCDIINIRKCLEYVYGAL